MVLFIFLYIGNCKKKKVGQVFLMCEGLRDLVNKSIVRYHDYLHSKIEEPEADILRHLSTQLAGMG